MQISVSDAKGHLLELVRLAQSGEDVVLTRRGVEVVRLTPIAAPLTTDAKRRALDDLQAKIRARPPAPGPASDRSQDFLYDQDGLPG